MFWIASCTKILSAMTIMKCVEEGMVTLDEDITVHVPELGKQAMYVPYTLIHFNS